MKKVLCGAALVSAMLLTGCAVNPKAPFQPANAGLFSNTTAPLSTEFHSASVSGLRMGEASTVNILGLFAFGDCGIHEAASNGNLTTVEFADYENLQVFGIYQKTTVKVYGR